MTSKVYNSFNVERIRSQPHDIITPPHLVPLPETPEDKTGFYVGTYRDPLRRSIHSIMAEARIEWHDKVGERSEDEGNEADIEDDQEETRMDRDDDSNDSGAVFLLDEEVWEMIERELALKKAADVNHLHVPVEMAQPVADYESLIPSGRHRRSGNERVHPRELQTSAGRERKLQSLLSSAPLPPPHPSPPTVSVPRHQLSCCELRHRQLLAERPLLFHTSSREFEPVEDESRAALHESLEQRIERWLRSGEYDYIPEPDAMSDDEFERAVDAMDLNEPEGFDPLQDHGYFGRH